MKKRLSALVITAALIINSICVFAANTELLLINDKLTDLSNVSVLRGFNYAWTWQNCTSESRRVFYRNNDSTGYAVYEADSACKAEFDVTVSNSDKWIITDKGQTDNILYLSENGADYTAASLDSGYSASVSLKSSQNNHYTFTLTYTFSSNYKYIKFDAGKFSYWQMYLIGARIYGTKALLKPEISPKGHVSTGDGFENGLGKASETSGFDINRYIGAKTGCSYTRIAAVKTSTGDAHLTYKAKSEDFCYITASITAESFDNAWRLTDFNELENNIYISNDGVTFTGVPGLKAKFTGESYDGNTGYSTFEIYGELPEGAEYLKIDAGEFQSWNFIINEIMMYSQYGENEFDYSKATSLAKVNAGYFNTAVAVEPTELYDYNDILLTQFNEITIENQMKANVIHQSENEYYFEGVDRIVEFAQKHGLRVRGHGLVYEKAMPSWMFVDENGNEASKELVMQRLENHVRTVVKRYKGKIYCYDLVNENFGHEGWDTRDLSRICGVDEYTRKVFQWAHEEDPDAILILNDNYYDIENKRNLIFNYVKGLVDDGVPIHGIGFQDHHFIDTDLDAVEKTLSLFETIPNFKLFITELDVRAYAVTEDDKVYPSFMDDELKAAVAKKYASLFDIYRRHAARIETLGLWNICDAVSWTDSENKHQFATLFGADKNPNPAYFAVLDTDGTLPRWDGGAMPPVLRNNNYTIDRNTDALTVKGTCSGTVTAQLYSNFGEKIKIAEKSVNTGGNYEITFDIDTDASYDGSVSPDYILEVSENGTVKTDEFTYFTTAQRRLYYTVTDNFSDYRKVYRARNTMFKNGGVAATRIWGNSASLGTGEVVYKCPEGFAPVSVTASMYKSGYTIYLSPDDVNYTKTSSATVTDIPENMRYIKIVMPTDRTNYLSYVKIFTKKLYGDGAITDSGLTDGTGFANNGFSLVSWAYERCGFSSPRNVLCNSGDKASMIFDAGEKRFTQAEFEITLHTNSLFHVNEEKYLNKMISFSDDGKTWTNSTVTCAKIGEATESEGVYYHHFRISCIPEIPARYVRFGSELPGNYQLFVQRARLFGRTAFKFTKQPQLSKMDGKYSASADFISAYGGEKAILAVYSGNRLVSCAVQDFEQSGEVKTINLSANTSADGTAYARLYIWTDGFAPIYITDNYN